MYGAKRKDVYVYQPMKDIYSLQQGKKLSDYYYALKAKWEDFDYYLDENWRCSGDQAIY